MRSYCVLDSHAIELTCTGHAREEDGSQIGAHLLWRTTLDPVVYPSHSPMLDWAWQLEMAVTEWREAMVDGLVQYTDDCPLI